MAVKARNYEAAKIVLWILGSIAWLQIIGGLFGLFAGGFGGGSQMEMTLMVAVKVLSAITVLSGLLSLALVQMASANVHSAEINWEMLEILRRSPAAGNATSGNVGSGKSASSENQVFEFEGNELSADTSFEVVSARGERRQAWRLMDGRVVIRTAAGFFKAFNDADELKKYIS